MRICVGRFDALGRWAFHACVETLVMRFSSTCGEQRTQYSDYSRRSIAVAWGSRFMLLGSVAGGPTCMGIDALVFDVVRSTLLISNRAKSRFLENERFKL
jgi:hypothetical protein